MDNECKRKLAANILLAAEKREDSWVESKSRTRAHYSKSLLEAAKEVCADEEEAVLISLILSETWIDVLEWANKVLVQAEGGKDD